MGVSPGWAQIQWILLSQPPECYKLLISVNLSQTLQVARACVHCGLVGHTLVFAWFLAQGSSHSPTFHSNSSARIF